MSEPYVLKWGILATGDNAKKFALDILLPPHSRNVQGIHHEITAVASSHSQTRAQTFLKEINAPKTATAHATYTSLTLDPNVQIIYIATPHSLHFSNALLSLKAGKHVLLEKAFTVNAEQAKILVGFAREKGLFLMEAIWTRFFPLLDCVRSVVGRGDVGVLQRVVTERCLGREIEVLYGVEHRLVNWELAGGALLDLGIYPLTWIFLFLYTFQPASNREIPTIVSSMIKYAHTNVDETVSMILSFPGSKTQGIATASLRIATAAENPGVRIQGSKGEIQVFGPAARPNYFKVIKHGSSGEELVEEIFNFEIPGHGLFWEADECARCLRDGKLESEVMPLSETVLVMEIMDQVRRQNGLAYSDALESLDG